MKYFIRVAFTQETEPDFVSKMIMKALGKPYSHVMILFKDLDGREKIFHSIGQGTCVMEKDEYLKTHKIVRQFKINMNVEQDAFCAYVKGRVGREYSGSQYINIILKMIGLKITLFKNQHAKAICSEEVAAAAHMADLDLPSIINFDLVTPEDVDRFLSSQPKAEKEIG
jgi:hypothetical protein